MINSSPKEPLLFLLILKMWKNVNGWLVCHSQKDMTRSHRDIAEQGENILWRG